MLLFCGRINEGNKAEVKIMPQFSYAIRDKLKKVLKGTTEAKSEKDLRKRFRSQGYLVFSINKVRQNDLSEEKPNPFENLKIVKLVLILLLIGGSYFVVKNVSRLSSMFEKKERPAKIKITPKEEAVDKPAKIIIEEVVSEPKQDIIVDEIEPKSKQKEDVVTITLKGFAKIPKSKTSNFYLQARRYYSQALGAKSRGSLSKKNLLRKAITYAQKALMSREGNEEEIKAFIRSCRKKLLK